MIAKKSPWGFVRFNVPSLLVRANCLRRASLKERNRREPFSSSSVRASSRQITAFGTSFPGFAVTVELWLSSSRTSFQEAKDSLDFLALLLSSLALSVPL